MTAQPAVTVSRDDVLAVCLAVVDEQARPISADTAASVAGLVARCADATRDEFEDQRGVPVILAMIGVVRERITELGGARPTAAVDQARAELAELAARTISWGRCGLTPAAERVLLSSVRSVLLRWAAGLSEA
jgi:hypothetical protein